MQSYLPVVELLHSAKDHIKWPKIRLENNYVLSIAGNNAKFPKSVNITDDKPYGYNVWFGRIFLNGQFQPAKHLAANDVKKLLCELDLFVQNPAEYAKGYGQLTNNCMYCGRQLTNPQSVAVGYGPICAAHYGLPYGELEQKIAEDMSQIEFEFPTGNVLDKKQEQSEYIAANMNLSTICFQRLSKQQYEELNERIADLDIHDYKSEYNLRITALWEHTI